MPGKLNNSKINFIKEDTDEIHIDKFLIDNFIHDYSHGEIEYTWKVNGKVKKVKIII